MNEGIRIIEKFDDVFMLMKLLEKYLRAWMGSDYDVC